jgi:hypothetical protein
MGQEDSMKRRRHTPEEIIRKLRPQWAVGAAEGHQRLLQQPDLGRVNDASGQRTTRSVFVLQSSAENVPAAL